MYMWAPPPDDAEDKLVGAPVDSDLHAKAVAKAREEILAAQQVPPVVVRVIPPPGEKPETERIDVLASLLNPALVRVARNYSEAAIRIALIPPQAHRSRQRSEC
jgi:hypothetical protein